jgi:PilZ domain
MNASFFNRRRFFRRTVNEPAWVEKVPSILERCTLTDLSKSGARLTISDTYDLPESLTLHLTLGSKVGRLCQVIWRRDDEIGVEFLREGLLKRTAPVIYPYNNGRRRSRMLVNAAKETSAAAVNAARAMIADLVSSLSARAPDPRLLTVRRRSASVQSQSVSRASRLRRRDS